MSEAVASLIARQRTEDLACGALPESVVRPEHPTGRVLDGGRVVRRAASASLRWLAARLEPEEAVPTTGVSCS